MQIDTFESAVTPGLFVTMPSATSCATRQIIEKFAAMKLGDYRLHYEFPDASCGMPFATSVMTKIVDEGYAMHGMDNAFRLTPEARD
jgi:hypothetical protein